MSMRYKKMVAMILWPIMGLVYFAWLAVVVLQVKRLVIFLVKFVMR